MGNILTVKPKFCVWQILRKKTVLFKYFPSHMKYGQKIKNLGNGDICVLCLFLLQKPVPLLNMLELITCTLMLPAIFIMIF